MKPLAIHHVSLNVSDVEASRRFFVDVLGFTERDDRPDFGFPGAWLDAGGQQLHLVEAPVPDNHFQHFAVQVADIASAVAELRALGTEVGDPSPVGTGIQAFLTDPDGNTVELHQAGAS